MNICVKACACITEVINYKQKVRGKKILLPVQIMFFGNEMS